MEEECENFKKITGVEWRDRGERVVARAHPAFIRQPFNVKFRCLCQAAMKSMISQQAIYYQEGSVVIS